MNKESVEFYSCIQSFLTKYLPEQRKLSSHTVRSYKDALNHLIAFIKERYSKTYDKISFSDLSSESMYAFMEWLEKKYNNSIGTVNCRLAAIKAFTSYAIEIYSIYSGSFLSVKSVRKRSHNKNDIVSYLDEDDLKVLLSIPDQNTDKGLRDQLLLILLYETAARETEIAKLKFCNFTFSNKVNSVKITGKGNKSRFIPISENVAKRVELYKNKFELGSDDSVFGQVRKGVMTEISGSSIYKIVAKYGKILHSLTDGRTPMPLHPHTLRHTRAMHWYLNGMQIEIVSALLGHSQLETTQIYAKANLKMKAEAIKKASASILLTDNQEKSFWDDEEKIKKLCGLS